ncbi:hypothetical protein K438DRAFT_1782865 [Mycena galopus ATCC 62051]|nr:hypothetical protein K438DRAFT_1782865 [Mycena galopus ATCC 62051]
MSYRNAREIDDFDRFHAKRSPLDAASIMPSLVGSRFHAKRSPLDAASIMPRLDGSRIWCACNLLLSQSLHLKGSSAQAMPDLGRQRSADLGIRTPVPTSAKHCSALGVHGPRNRSELGRIYFVGAIPPSSLLYINFTKEGLRKGVLVQAWQDRPNQGAVGIRKTEALGRDPPTPIRNSNPDSPLGQMMASPAGLSGLGDRRCRMQRERQHLSDEFGRSDVGTLCIPRSTVIYARSAYVRITARTWALNAFEDKLRKAGGILQQ